MRLIPAIDIIDGKCVRLSRGDYSTRKVYNENPLEVARMFEANGLEYLHLVDLDGAAVGRVVNYKILEKISAATGLKIDFGGGLRSGEDVRIAFESGAVRITGGSIAVQQPHVFEGWLKDYGNDRIILGADSKDRKIAVSGWTEVSGRDVVDFIACYEQKGVKYVICTDIAKDGMLNGPSFMLYREILSKTGVRLIASGGVTSLEDLSRLKETGCEGVIIGKALYEGRIDLKELEKYVKE
ncbi:MAG TPA: 1-(5-phosphoribosyl)-5-[(5-phosphoribosylamino)methylideneamino]imidazole-4-carboxamide isomerase [Desulfobacteraceae bacterium]|nr:1-(5-phosphoribosyl)-5-[(5-phosphoribosylamino)methylideneamino]imidazole-4-carboxamide isomerase [Desulfobacteraceae bacterium]